MSDQENNPDNNNIKYSSYTEAQKRATQKYRSNNKDKVNEQRKKYYQQRKENDPEFLEYKRAKAREYYQRKKQSSSQQQLNDDMELPDGFGSFNDYLNHALERSIVQTKAKVVIIDNIIIKFHF